MKRTVTKKSLKRFLDRMCTLTLISVGISWLIIIVILALNAGLKIVGWI